MPLEPRVTADQSGGLPGIYATYNAVDPATVVPSTTSYSSAGANSGRVGRSVVYVIRSVDNGATWSAPTPVDPAGGRGHQYFSDVDALGGKLVAVWQDNRTDDAYSVQLPIGNTLDAPGSSGLLRHRRGRHLRLGLRRRHHLHPHGHDLLDDAPAVL